MNSLISDFREISFLGFFLEREIIANALVYNMFLKISYSILSLFVSNSLLKTSYIYTGLWK
jgi:hypothetical protein